MRMRVLRVALPLLLLLAAPASAAKEGYLGQTYLDWDTQSRLLYTVGVADALDAFGIRCPAPVPTYQQIVDETIIFIYQNPTMRDLFASKAIIGAMAKRGCRRE